MTNPEDGEGFYYRYLCGWADVDAAQSRSYVCLNPANETNPAVLKVDEILDRHHEAFIL